MALQTAEGWIALRFYSIIFLVLKLYLQLGELPYRKIDLIKLTTLLLISSKKANHSCLNQFACSVLYIYFCQNSWSLTAIFLDASQLFSIIPFIAEAASLPTLSSMYVLWATVSATSVSSYWFSFAFFSKVQSSNQKPASEFHSNLVSLTDPFATKKS